MYHWKKSTLSYTVNKSFIMNNHNQKNILFVIDSLGGGGAERIISYLANHLDRNKFKISLCLSLGSVIDYNISEDVRICLLQRSCSNIQHSFIGKILSFFYKSHLGTFIFSSRAFKDIIEKERPHLIVSFLPNSNIITLLTKILFKTTIPICCSDRNNVSLEIKRLPYPTLRRIFSKTIYKKADMYIAISEGVKENLIRNFKFPEKKIVTIYNGVNRDYVEAQSHEPLEGKIKDILSNKEIYKIITVGRLTAQKNHECLLKAFRQVTRTLNCHLFILGEGEKREDIETLSSHLHINNEVHFLGWEKNPFKYMKLCDLFVLTSLWEGFGNVLIEAMALGLPIISTNCPFGPSEILDNGKYGILVPSDNPDALSEAIVRVLINKGLRKDLSRKSQQRASEFSMEKMLNAYESLFLRMTNDL